MGRARGMLCRTLELRASSNVARRASTRLRMRNAVFRQIPHCLAVSLRSSACAWHAANSIHVSGRTFVPAKTLLECAVKLRLHFLQVNRCLPAASRPRFECRGEPQRGQCAVSLLGDGDSASSSFAMSACRDSMASSRMTLSAGSRGIALVVSDMIARLSSIALRVSSICGEFCVPDRGQRAPFLSNRPEDEGGACVIGEGPTRCERNGARALRYVRPSVLSEKYAKKEKGPLTRPFANQIAVYTAPGGILG